MDNQFNLNPGYRQASSSKDIIDNKISGENLNLNVNLNVNQNESVSNDYFNQLFNSLQQTKADLKSLNIDVECNEIYNEREKTQLKENVTIRANPTRRIGFNNQNIPNNVCINQPKQQYNIPQAHSYTPVQPLFEHKLEDNVKYGGGINNNDNYNDYAGYQNVNVNVKTQVNGPTKINTMNVNNVNVNKNAQNISHLKTNIADIMNDLKSMKSRNGGI